MPHTTTHHQIGLRPLAENADVRLSPPWLVVVFLAIWSVLDLFWRSALISHYLVTHPPSHAKPDKGGVH